MMPSFKNTASIFSEISFIQYQVFKREMINQNAVVESSQVKSGLQVLNLPPVFS